MVEQKAPKDPFFSEAPLRAFVAFLASLAIPSALLSAYASFDPWEIFVLKIGSDGPLSAVPLLPAVYYGLVLCAGIYLWDSKNWRRLAVAFAAVLIAWASAYEIALRLYDFLTGGLPLKTSYAALAIAGMAGGFIGSLVTSSGVCFASKDARTRAFLVRTVLVGTSAGSLLVYTEGPDLLLFLVWQPAVAASIAYAICQPKLKGNSAVPLQLIRRSEVRVLAIILIVFAGVGIAFRQIAERQLYTAAQGDATKLEAYVASCRYCTDEHAAQAQISKIRAQEALTQELTNQEDESYRAAGTDAQKLKAYIQSCKVCIHADAARRVIQEDSQYWAARGEYNGLRSYINSCQACVYRDAALQLVDSIARAEREAKQYAAARGDIGQLRAYADSCTVCAFKSAAFGEINTLTLEQQRVIEQASKFDFSVCNNSSIVANVAILSYSTDYSAWMTEGWWMVPIGRCQSLGRFKKGMFYYYAYGDNVQWLGSFPVCVRFIEFHDHNSGASCGPNVRNFTANNILDDKFVWTLGAVSQ